MWGIVKAESMPSKHVAALNPKPETTNGKIQLLLVAFGYGETA